MKKKFQRLADYLIESNRMFLHEFDGATQGYRFTDDPRVAWAFTADAVTLRLGLVQRSHPQAKIVSRPDAIRAHNLRTVGQSHGTGQ